MTTPSPGSGVLALPLSPERWRWVSRARCILCGSGEALSKSPNLLYTDSQDGARLGWEVWTCPPHERWRQAL
jgi:hypothetical protein